MVAQFTVHTCVHHIRLNNFWIDLASKKRRSRRWICLKLTELFLQKQILLQQTEIYVVTASRTTLVPSLLEGDNITTDRPGAEAPGDGDTLEEHEEEQGHPAGGVLVKQLEHVYPALAQNQSLS